MDFGFKKVLTTTNQLLACMRLCQEGHMVSGYSCYDSKHKNYNGHSNAAYKKPTIEQVNFCSR